MYDRITTDHWFFEAPVVLKLEYPILKRREPKGFSWFVEVDQAIEILQRRKTIGVFHC